jgi:hypothetical protein
MSLRKAINAKCKACLYDQVGGSGSWRKQVANCTSFTCALYGVRPTPTTHSSEKRSSVLGAKNVLFEGETDRIGGDAPGDSKEEEHFVPLNLAKV